MIERWRGEPKASVPAQHLAVVAPHRPTHDGQVADLGHDDVDLNAALRREMQRLEQHGVR